MAGLYKRLKKTRGAATLLLENIIEILKSSSLSKKQEKSLKSTTDL